MITHWHPSVSWTGDPGLVEWRLACGRALIQSEQTEKRTKGAKMDEMMLKWNSNKRRRTTIGQSLQQRRVKRSEVPCRTIRHDGVVEALWRFRYAGQARSAVQQCATPIPANFVDQYVHLGRVLRYYGTAASSNGQVLVRLLFLVPGGDQSVGHVEPRAARIFVGSFFLLPAVLSTI